MLSTSTNAVTWKPHAMDDRDTVSFELVQLALWQAKNGFPRCPPCVCKHANNNSPEQSLTAIICGTRLHQVGIHGVSEGGGS